MDPALHDQEVALVSHIPGLLSADYLNFVEETDAHSLSIAGPGFRSFTRLAHANPALRRDIKEANARWISHYLERWRAFGSQ
jgi:prephenate dehydrogenase